MKLASTSRERTGHSDVPSRLTQGAGMKRCGAPSRRRLVVGCYLLQMLDPGGGRAEPKERATR